MTLGIIKFYLIVNSYMVQLCLSKGWPTSDDRCTKGECSSTSAFAEISVLFEEIKISVLFSVSPKKQKIVTTTRVRIRGGSTKKELNFHQNTAQSIDSIMHPYLLDAALDRDRELRDLNRTSCELTTVLSQQTLYNTVLQRQNNALRIWMK